MLAHGNFKFCCFEAFWVIVKCFVWGIFWIHGYGGSTMYWDWTIKLSMAYREPDFSLLEWEIIDKQGKTLEESME